MFQEEGKQLFQEAATAVYKEEAEKAKQQQQQQQQQEKAVEEAKQKTLYFPVPSTPQATLVIPVPRGILNGERFMYVGQEIQFQESRTGKMRSQTTWKTGQLIRLDDAETSKLEGYMLVLRVMAKLLVVHRSSDIDTGLCSPQSIKMNGRKTSRQRTMKRFLRLLGIQEGS